MITVSSGLLVSSLSQASISRAVWLPQLRARTNSTPSSLAPFRNAPTGVGACQAHHGEWFQGVLVEPETAKPQREGLVRCLWSVHMPVIGADATFKPDSTSVKISVTPTHFGKARRAARLTLAYLRLRRHLVGAVGGDLRVRTHVRERLGLGASTAGVVASIRAVANSFGVVLDADVEADIAVRAEHASDSVMYDVSNNAPLFAHREARILKWLPRPLPPMRVVGLNTDVTSGVGVETDKLPRARYSPEEIEAGQVAIGAMERAVITGNADLIGRVATMSSEINQRFLPKPKFSDLKQLSTDCGGVGIQVAHSGTVVGIIFDATVDDIDHRAMLARGGIGELGFELTYDFATKFSNAGHVR